jgi:hypothetical protein
LLFPLSHKSRKLPEIALVISHCVVGIISLHPEVTEEVLKCFLHRSFLHVVNGKLNI